MEKKILIYSAGNKEKEDKIKTILHPEYTVEFISENELNQKLGYHFRLEGFDREDTETDESIAFDAMFLPVIPHEEIRELSTKLREQNADIERKAMLTEHNRNWTILDLLKEINEEHTYFKKRAELNQLLLNSTKVKPEDIDAEIAPDFQKAVLFAYDTLQDKESTTELFEKAIDTLLPLYQKVN